MLIISIIFVFCFWRRVDLSLPLFLFQSDCAVFFFFFNSILRPTTAWSMPLLSSSSSSSSSPFTLSSSSSSSSFHILRLQFPSRSLVLSPPLPPPRSSSLLRSTPKPPPPPLLRIAAAAMASSDSGVAGAGNADPRIPRIASSIRVIPNFPKPGASLSLSLLGFSWRHGVIEMFGIGRRGNVPGHHDAAARSQGV